MVTIYLDNNKCKIDCTLVELKKFRNDFRIRAAGAFFAEAFRNRTWDGFVQYITEAGYIVTGLVPDFVSYLEKNSIKYKIIDKRIPIKAGTIPDKIGKLELRGYQRDSVLSVITNKVGGVEFYRGLLNEATNAGKTLLGASLYLSFNKQPTIILINRTFIYEQLIQELTAILGNQVGYIGPKGIKWGNFMICMAPTLKNHLIKFSFQLSQFKVAIVDECHYAGSPTYKAILDRLSNCFVRIGLSGTSQDHKDKNKKRKIQSYFGNILHVTKNHELIELGFSTPPQIAIIDGNSKVKIKGDYKEELTKGLTHSNERNLRVVKRVNYHLKRKRIPMLVIAKYHNHTELLFKKISKKYPELNISYIHTKVKNKAKVLADFKNGKIDILVSSLLIKEGQNLPLIKSMIVASGGDSVITTLQLVGRALRTHKTKDKVYIDDFMDDGHYLKRHSRRRIKTYKLEKFKIINKSTIK